MTARIGGCSARVRSLLGELGFIGPGVTDWRADAACVSTDPELFYPVGSGHLAREQVTEAKRVCSGCPVRALCLADAMASEDPALRWGVTGGLSAPERGELFAQHRHERRAVA